MLNAPGAGEYYGWRYLAWGWRQDRQQGMTGIMETGENAPLLRRDQLSLA